LTINFDITLLAVPSNINRVERGCLVSY
jgi:hypothetical protein